MQRHVAAAASAADGFANRNARYLRNLYLLQEWLCSAVLGVFSSLRRAISVRSFFMDKKAVVTIIFIAFRY